MFSSGSGWDLDPYQLSATLFLLICLLPYSPISQIRYYGCYIFYVVSVSTLCLISTPIFILRPRNIDNLRIAGIITRRVTEVIGIQWELRRPEILERDRSAVIVANHQSCFDVLGMLNIWHIMKKCTAVAKKEIFYVIPFGPVAWLAGLTYIDRKNGKAAYSQISEAASLMKNLKAKLWLFPEGTRNRNGDKLLPFKKGAFRIAIECQQPIIPVVYSPYYFIRSGTKEFGRGKVIIEALEPIDTKGMTLENLDSIMEKTYLVMSEAYSKLACEASLGTPTGNYKQSR